MPAPVALAPIAWKVAQFSAIAALGYYSARRRTADDPADLWRETALNEIDEGLKTEVSRGENGTRFTVFGKIRRGLRIGREGTGVEVELASIARVRIRKI